MTPRLSRREIKQDELVATFEKGVDYAQHHTRGLLTGVGVVVAVLAVAWGGWFWAGRRSAAANELLGRAIQVAQAPLDAAAPKPDDPVAPSFADATARRQKAEELLRQVQGYRWTDAADVAGVYLGDLAAEAGDTARARELWRDYVDDHPRDMLAAAARLNLIRLDRQDGKGEQVAAELKAMLEDADRPLPEDVVLWELASTLESLGKVDEARPHYQRLVDDFSRSPYHADAQRKLGAPQGGGLSLSS
jgi:tetratricopeptide (TPR) repeat protein